VVHDYEPPPLPTVAPATGINAIPRVMDTSKELSEVGVAAGGSQFVLPNSVLYKMAATSCHTHFRKCFACINHFWYRIYAFPLK